MSELEHELGNLLTTFKLTLATAESCTGGLIANRITDVSGSSRYFERGVITYSNESKSELLKVPLDIIDQFGAVSSNTVSAMATGIKKLAHTDLGLAVTGIAGPDGGTPEKPVGLVYIALADDENIDVREFKFTGTRTEIKHLTSDAALKMVLDHVKNRFKA